MGDRGDGGDGGDGGDETEGVKEGKGEGGEEGGKEILADGRTGGPYKDSTRGPRGPKYVKFVPSARETKRQKKNHCYLVSNELCNKYVHQLSCCLLFCFLIICRIFLFRFLQQEYHAGRTLFLC